LFFKFLVLPFGRCEIEEDLRSEWHLSSPDVVPTSVF
jgi:hypothetical protein